MERFKEWIENNRDILIISLIGLLLVITLIITTYYEVKECHNKGGEFEEDGTYSTIYVNSGDIIIPIETENLSCSE